MSQGDHLGVTFTPQELLNTCEYSRVVWHENKSDSHWRQMPDVDVFFLCFFCPAWMGILSYSRLSWRTWFHLDTVMDSDIPLNECGEGKRFHGEGLTWPHQPQQQRTEKLELEHAQREWRHPLLRTPLVHYTLYCGTINSSGHSYEYWTT